jgi:hypothetical protein
MGARIIGHEEHKKESINGPRIRFFVFKRDAASARTSTMFLFCALCALFVLFVLRLPRVLEHDHHALARRQLAVKRIELFAAMCGERASET